MEKTFAKGLGLLEALVAIGEPVSVTRLANMQGLYKSNVHRLLRTMVACGYVSQTEQGLYLPTLRLTELGLTVWEQGSIAELAQSALSRVATNAATGAYLLVPERGQLRVMAAAHASEMRHHPLRMGDTLAYASSVRMIADLHASAAVRPGTSIVQTIEAQEAAGHLALCPLWGLVVPIPFTLALWAPSLAGAEALTTRLPTLAEDLTAALGGNDAVTEAQDSETV